jgi:hypothetical protein
MTAQPIAEEADRLSRSRVRMLNVLALMFIFQLIASFSNEHEPLRAVDHFRIAAWLILSIVLLAALATGGFWFRSRQLRDLLDDETTRVHRGHAMTVGFLASMAACILIYFYSWAEPLDARHAIHIVMTAGIASGLLAFSFFERRAHQDG